MAFADQITSLVKGLSGLNEAQKFAFRNAILMEDFAGVNLRENRRTLSEQRNGSKIPILLKNRDFSGFPTVAGCELPSCDWDIPASSFKWSIGEIGCEFTLCLKDLVEDFRAFWDLYLRMNRGDMNSAFVDFVTETYQERLRDAMFRVYYFGDTEAEIDLDDDETAPDTSVNALDGAIKQYIAHGVNRVTIPNNTAIETDGATILGYIQDLYDIAVTKPWFREGNMKLEMNEELVGAVVGYLNSQNDLKGIGAQCGCIDPNKVTQARQFQKDNLTIFGIKVVPLPFTQAQAAVPSYDGPVNIIILNREDNDILGFETEDALENFNVGYDDRKRKLWFQGTAMFGAGIPTDAFAIAY